MFLFILLGAQYKFQEPDKMEEHEWRKKVNIMSIYGIDTNWPWRNYQASVVYMSLFNSSGKEAIWVELPL